MKRIGLAVILQLLFGSVAWFCSSQALPIYFPLFVVGYIVIICIYMRAFYRLLGEYKKYVSSPPVWLLSSKKVQQVLHQSKYDPAVVKRIREEKEWRFATILYFCIGLLLLCIFAFLF